MVIGYHLIWTAYGWWLPNDPRGSNSHEMRVARIEDLGPLHPGRKSVQPSSHELRAFYQEAQDRLAHEPLVFNDGDVALIAESFAQVIREEAYTCHACAIMPDHVHILIARQRDWAETMIEKFQKRSRDALIAAGQQGNLHPVWGGPGWKVFLNTAEDMVRIVNYIQHNPVKAGKAEQVWRFVKVYELGDADSGDKRARNGSNLKIGMSVSNNAEEASS
jgi:REP element-mobilizing transposase RayT